MLIGIICQALDLFRKMRVAWVPLNPHRAIMHLPPEGLVLSEQYPVSFPNHRVVESRKKAVQRIEEQLMKLEVQATDREENKQIALGTSKLNYLDPRISVAW